MCCCRRSKVEAAYFLPGRVPSAYWAYLVEMYLLYLAKGRGACSHILAYVCSPSMFSSNPHVKGHVKEQPMHVVSVLLSCSGVPL